MARSLLGRALARGKLAHAYLIAGPEGCGKRTLALDFAAALVCEARSFPGCGRCGSCRRMFAGSHPDVTVLEPEGRQIKIKQVRELSSRLHYHSFEGGRKVGVIPYAEHMTEEAQNAFLKTLEEPTADTMLILTASNLNRVLPTILSRCQLLRLGPLPGPMIERLVQERRGLDPETARLVAALARGNAARALELETETAIGLRKTMLERLLGLSPEDRLDMLKFAEELSKPAELQAELMEMLAGFYLDALHCKLGAADPVNRDLSEGVRSEAGRQTLADLLDKLQAVYQARNHLSQNANPRLVWELLTMSLVGVEGARIQGR